MLKVLVKSLFLDSLFHPVIRFFVSPLSPLLPVPFFTVKFPVQNTNPTLFPGVN